MGCANSKNSSLIEPVGVPARSKELNDDKMNLNESNNNKAKGKLNVYLRMIETPLKQVELI